VKAKKRHGTTLVEVLVSMVLFSIFMLMVTGVFRITYSAYEQNYLMAQRLYVESNMENLFQILEKEFMYQGSMGHVLKNIEGFPGNSLSISDSGSVATITYALAEKLVLSRENWEQYPVEEDKKIEQGNTYAFFAHFPARLPLPMQGNDKVWALNYDSFHQPESAQLFTAEFNTAEFNAISTGELVTYVEVKTIKVDGKNPLNEDEEPLNFISLFQKEQVLAKEGKYFKIKEDGEGEEKWTGERVYRTCFSLEGETVKMERYIPTVDATISMDLLDEVEEFSISDNDDFFTVTATCSLSLPSGASTGIQLVKSRRFFKW